MSLQTRQMNPFVLHALTGISAARSQPESTAWQTCARSGIRPRCLVRSPRPRRRPCDRPDRGEAGVARRFAPRTHGQSPRVRGLANGFGGWVWGRRQARSIWTPRWIRRRCDNSSRPATPTMVRDLYQSLDHLAIWLTGYGYHCELVRRCFRCCNKQDRKPGPTR